jgi:hypothetical protein
MNDLITSISGDVQSASKLDMASMTGRFTLPQPSETIAYEEWPAFFRRI